MSNATITDKLFSIRYKCDEASHLAIKDQEVCGRCTGKTCTTVCPAEVYEWEAEAKVNRVAYENCVECGTCRIACSSDNIEWRYPKGGYGITYRFG